MITAIRFALTALLVWLAALGHQWALFLVLALIVVTLELNSMLVVRLYDTTRSERSVQEFLKALRGRR